MFAITFTVTLHHVEYMMKQENDGSNEQISRRFYCFTAPVTAASHLDSQGFIPLPSSERDKLVIIHYLVIL